MILDERGQLVWFAPLAVDFHSLNDVRVQRYRGRPVLTWWEGVSAGGYGLGHFVVMDASYQTIAQVQVGNGYPGADLHEFLITPRGTALVLIYNPVRWDHTRAGAAADRVVMDGIVQEIELATGRVLFEWHCLDHVGLDESYLGPPDDPNDDFDYFHVNAVGLDRDGHLIVTARNTWATYKIDRVTGEIHWRLGGKRSDFVMGPGTESAYHHDARVRPNGDLTLFDNAAAPPVRDESRGLVIRLDMATMTATLVRAYTHPNGVLAGSQGNLQTLPNGNVLVGWGSEPVVSEFAADGTVLFEVRFPEGTNSYRAYRSPWTGRPSELPAVAAEPGPGGGMTVYASWNGATEVADWEVLAGPTPDQLELVGTAPRDGFETAIELPAAGRYVAVRAMDRTGTPLGTSDPVEPRT
jgi:hypothetical protein